jgi:glycosyltransferase involved in cell wall biosynthesis
VGATFKRLFGVPLVVRPYGGDDIRPAGRVRRRPRLAQRLYQALGAADAVIAQGRFVQGTILELGVDPSRLYVINNGIDLKAFSVGTAFPHPRPYILGLGSLAWHKGFDVLLRAYARLQPPVPDLLLAGHGSVRPALETLAQQLRIASRVTFLGFVGGQDKINLLRSAQLFVSPSRREAFSNVILEALAAGLPVIASAVGGNPELVPHGQHGLLVPPEDDVALARALQTVLHHPAQLATMRAAVPAFVQAFDWPIITQAYLDLYRTLVR